MLECDKESLDQIWNRVNNALEHKSRRISTKQTNESFKHAKSEEITQEISATT
jgi:hypothetical protein